MYAAFHVSTSLHQNYRILHNWEHAAACSTRTDVLLASAPQ